VNLHTKRWLDTCVPKKAKTSYILNRGSSWISTFKNMNKKHVLEKLKLLLLKSLVCSFTILLRDFLLLVF
jgi:hypothetical protein